MAKMKLRICPVCRVGMTDKEYPLWCPYVDCAETKQREPTDFQKQKFGFGEDPKLYVQRNYRDDVYSSKK